MSRQFRFRQAVRCSVLLTAVLLAAGSLHAEQLVTFSRGQSIVVQSSEMRDGWYFFVLEGGGELGVPIGQVATVEDYEAPAAPANVAPVTAAATPAYPGGGQPAAAQSPVGGNPATLPGQAAMPGANPGSQPANPMAAGEDWRYKLRMNGGARPGMQTPRGIANQNPGGMVSFGAQRPGLPGPQRRVPPPQKNPQN
jgi:hypothetical protein